MLIFFTKFSAASRAVVEVLGLILPSSKVSTIVIKLLRFIALIWYLEPPRKEEVISDWDKIGSIAKGILTLKSGVGDPNESFTERKIIIQSSIG